MIKAVIFDFDGLLVDSEPIYVKANKKFLSERGITDFSIINRIFGMKAEETFELMKKEFSLEGTIDDLMNIRNGYIIEDFKNGELNLMPYMIETLEELSKDYPLAIGSSSKKVLIDTAMEIYKFSHFFKDLVCGDDAKKGKPDPEIYLKNAFNLNIDPSFCVVLEDSPNGILAGKRAGMKTIAIPNEQTMNLDFSHADYITTDLKKAISIIKSI